MATAKSNRAYGEGSDGIGEDEIVIGHGLNVAEGDGVDSTGAEDGIDDFSAEDAELFAALFDFGEEVIGDVARGAHDDEFENVAWGSGDVEIFVGLDVSAGFAAEEDDEALAVRIGWLKGVGTRESEPEHVRRKRAFGGDIDGEAGESWR